MVKKLLKFIISVAIIAGLVYGVIYLVNRNKPNDYVYKTLSSEESIKLEILYGDEESQNAQSKVKKCIDLLKQDVYKDKDDDKITPLLEHSYNYFDKINDMSYIIYNSLIDKSLFAQTATRELQNNVIDSLNDLKECREDALDKLDLLERYLDSEKSTDAEHTTLKISYLYDFFEDFVVEYKNYTLAVSQLTFDLSEYVIDDVYLNKTNSLKQLVSNSAALFNLEVIKNTEVNWDGTETEFMKIVNKVNNKCKNVLDGNDSYSQQLLQISYHYNECPDINAFLTSNNKIEFLANLDTDENRRFIAHYNAVSKYLYGEEITSDQIAEYKQSLKQPQQQVEE